MGKKRKGDSSDDDSGEDQHIIEEEHLQMEREPEPDEDDMFEDELNELFEDSQILTQIVPRRSGVNNVTTEEQSSSLREKKKKYSDEASKHRESPQKKSKHKEPTHREFTNRESTDEEATQTESIRRKSTHKEATHIQQKTHRGYRVREINVSEIPDHIIANMKRVLPDQSNRYEGPTVGAVQDSATSSDGGVWILKCPQDVNLSNLLEGKKLELGEVPSVQDLQEDDDSVQLTQFAPNDSLGLHVKSRRFEATSIPNDQSNVGAVLMLPHGDTGIDKFKLVAVPIQGQVIIRECITHPDLIKVKAPKLPTRKLPPGIKERHPVYGVDFSKIINEMELAPTPKRKKKKSLETNGFLGCSNGAVEYFPRVTNSNRVVKLEEDEHMSTRKHKKKKKKKSYDQDDNETDKLCKQEIILETYTSEEVHHSTSAVKTKSKKRKRELEESYEDFNETVEVNEPPPKKFKKSKKK